MKYFYSTPFEVEYLWEKEYRFGIAFHEWIIDLVDGQVHELDIVYEIGRYYDIEDDEIVVERCEWKPIIFKD